MPPKRKDGSGGDEPTGREKKKQKMAVARTIAVQPMKSVSFSANTIAGPSSRPTMDPVRKKALGRSIPKLGRSKRIKRTELFARRQIHPTEKAYRPSHRASIHGSILHDASYYSLIELKGPEAILKKVLDTCCDPHGPGPGSKRYSPGLRALETYFYKPSSYPFGLISPLTVIWRPLPTDSAPPEPQNSNDQSKETITDPDASTSTRKRKAKGKGKEKEQEKPTTRADTDAHRVVWLRVHPSAYEEVLSSLQASTSLSLDAARRESGGKEIEVEIADLRGQVNAFEIMGPKSNQVLRGALSPISQDQRAEFKSFWSHLANVQSSGEISNGTIVGFKVVDPRLKFPPKNAKAQAPNRATFIIPSTQLAQSEIWDEAVRARLTNPRYKKRDLDERRSKVGHNSHIREDLLLKTLRQLLIPGTQLSPERLDDRVPVLLIQRSLSSSDFNTQGIYGWTLIVPAGWSMPFLSSLIFTGTRIAGQRERQTQAFEAGVPYFPRDLPTSTGYETYASTREKEEKERWERKPPAKRPNFEKLGTCNPWRADWEGLLGLPRLRSVPCVPEGEEEGLVTTQREQPVAETAVEVEPEIGPRMWLLRGSEVLQVIGTMSKLFNHNAGLLQEINRLRAKRGHEALDSTVKADDLMKGALVSVRIKMCKRGAPEDLAIIYSVDDEEAKRWGKTLRSRNLKAVHDEETPEELELSEIVPPESSSIGYVTTGHFTLSQGQGSAIGAIPLLKFIALQEQSLR
ncbi:hypothetical protein DXG03_002356 [Asterophora parasitica]|uniref:POPLD-domain-containing protein n=1 Tax=Asterophora parasitica TaxID=117018 RepID=A0A9P7G8X7_9AGAR|nr:hypothetical protein DXG03_002356 [Asterophora parasitica]